MQLLVPAPRVSLHHQERVLQGCKAAHSLSPAAKQGMLQQPPVPAPLPQAGTQAGAQPVPTTCHGLASHWSLLLEGSRQATGQELLCSSELIGF